MEFRLLRRFLQFVFRIFKRESKELYFSLEMRRPQNLEEREQLKKLRLIP